MKTCKIEIVTFTEGERSRFTAVGRLEERTDGFAAVYPAERDEARLELGGDSLVMHRRGGSELHARFCAGETGEFRVGLDDRFGVIPLHTQTCAARRVSDGWRIALAYRLQFEGEVRIFRLHIAVNIISEEQ